jgi:hypothetical protein
MAPSLKKALKAFKKSIPEGNLPPVPGTPNLQGVSTGLPRSLFSSIHDLKTSAQFTNTAHNLQSQASKGLQNTPVQKAVPKGVAVLKPITKTFERHYSRLRRMVH